MKNSIIIFILVCVIMGGFYVGKTYYENKIAGLMTAIKTNLDLIEEKNGVIGRQANIINNQDEALSYLQNDLNKTIREKNLVLRENISLRMEIDSFSTHITVGEPVISDSGTYYPVGPFRWEIFSLEWRIWSTCKPQDFEWSIKQVEPFDLSLGLAETKDRQIKFAYGKSSWESMEIDTIVFNYTPYSKPWYEKIHVDLGFASSLDDKNPAGVMLGLGYDKIGGGILVNSEGRSYYASYRWSPF